MCVDEIKTLGIAADWHFPPEGHERSGRGIDGTTDHSGRHAGHQNFASLASSAILASDNFSYVGLVTVDARSV